MEEKIFPRPAVAAALERFIEARLHTDYEKFRTMQMQMLGTITAPAYAIVAPNTGKVMAVQQGWLPGNDGADFVAWLNSAR